MERTAVEIWSPLPPQASGVADYVEEQLPILDAGLGLTLVAADPNEVDEGLRRRYLVVSPSESNPEALRLYHIGNSSLHGFIYEEAIRTPGVVVLHEWNLHELLLGSSVRAHDFGGYRARMRREYGARGSVAADTIAAALGGNHWTSLFPLNSEILEQALGVVCLSGSTAARVAARRPLGLLLHLPHHALLRAHASNRSEARMRLGIAEDARVILAPGLATASKAIEAAEAAIESIRPKVGPVVLVTVGGGPSEDPVPKRSTLSLGRVELKTLGDSLLAADVVLALRFPSRGETSGVLMRALAAGRAAVVSSGATADEDLPQGVVARVNPGPHERQELAALLEFLLGDKDARLRMERLARSVADTRRVGPLTETLTGFLREVAAVRGDLEPELRLRASKAGSVRDRIRDDLEAAASSLGLSHVPPGVFERLAGL